MGFTGPIRIVVPEEIGSVDQGVQVFEPQPPRQFFEFFLHLISVDFTAGEGLLQYTYVPMHLTLSKLN